MVSFRELVFVVDVRFTGSVKQKIGPLHTSGFGCDSLALLFGITYIHSVSLTKFIGPCDRCLSIDVQAAAKG